VRIVFAGGGTGGHLFPGIALAQHLLRREPGSAVFFLCTERPFDARQLAAYGMPHAPLAAPRLREPRFALRMTDAVRAAATALRVFAPDVLLGLGGYGSAPSLLAALAYGVPVAVMEQNVVPGKANLAAARAAKRIYAQWEESRGHFRAGSRFRATGSPLREGLEPMPKRDARRLLGLPERGPVLGVVGGSQGAESMNAMVLAELEGFDGRAPAVLHLAGPSSAEVEAAYRRAGIRAVVLPFVREMERVYSACDLVVSRAGAMAIAELARFGVASVLVPYPHAAEDHQSANARALAQAGAAWLVEEKRGGIAPVVEMLVSGDGALDNRRNRISRFARPDAARAILGDLRAWLSRA
jgi:UDP-N-acetylglucosamine--N-acetylmuramyl-(pentapeptide) pyrophosphoryl-undecaprenol N-acetylglucosamine transferase